jgi:predicted aspartyl protease
VTFSFNGRRGLILVTAALAGPTGRVIVRLALDTGATRTVVSPLSLRSCGYDPVSASEQTFVTSVTRRESFPRLKVSEIAALGRAQRDFPVIAQPLPANLRIDGLLGLDFLRGAVLTVDFKSGAITLT